MPNKTIYVREEDLPVFEEAEKLGGDSLSGIIAEALRRFVAVKRAEMFGMQEYTLPAGVLRSQGADTRKVRFVGRLLAEAEVLTGQTSSQDDRGTDYRVYQTKAGKIIVHWRRWSRWDGEGSSADYAVLDQLPGHGAEIYGQIRDDDDYIEPYPEKLPGSLLQDAAEALGQELVEFIE